MDDYLEHHGVLGMKWGVRRTQQQLGHTIQKKKKIKAKVMKQAATQKRKEKRAAEKAKIQRYQNKLEKRYGISKTSDTDQSKPAPKPKPTKISEMSNEELQAFIARKSLEKQYMELISEQSPKKSDSFIKKTATKFANATVDQLVKQGSAMIAKNVVNSVNSVNSYSNEDAKPNSTGAIRESVKAVQRSVKKAPVKSLPPTAPKVMEYVNSFDAITFSASPNNFNGSNIVSGYYKPR